MSWFKSLAGAVLVVLLSTTGAHAALSDYFVSTAWLAEHRSESTVVDVRNSAVYLLGHIEGALSVTRDQFLETRDGTPSLVPSAARLESLLGGLGIGPATTVVAYAAADDPYAARFVWTLRYYGHDRAYVLDGGYEKWHNEEQPTALLPSASPAPVSYRVARQQEIRAAGDYVRSQLGSRTTLIWDTRKQSEYLGTEVRADRGGHIPGAVNLDWRELQHEVNGVKVLKDEAAIRELLRSRGIDPGKQIIPHCQTGIRSSYASLVLLGLGYPEVKNYDGSWIEWANNPERPVLTGEGRSDETELVLKGRPVGEGS